MSPEQSTDLMPAPESHALAPVAPPDKPWSLSAQVQRLWSSVAPGTEEDTCLWECEIGEPTLSKEKAYNRPLNMVAAMVCRQHGVSRDTGEVYDGPRTSILLDTGETLRFASVYIVQSIAVLAQGRVQGAWEPPIVVTLEAIDVGMAGPKLVLRRVRPALPAPQTKGAKRG